MSMKNNHAIIFFGWGPKYIDLVTHCVRESRLPPYPIFLITDTATDIGGLPAGLEVVRDGSQLWGEARKIEVFLCLPEQIERVLPLGAGSGRNGAVWMRLGRPVTHR